jgi:hypothetical protein
MLRSERLPYIGIALNDYINPEHIERAYIDGSVLYIHFISGRGRTVSLYDPRFPEIAEEVEQVMRRKFTIEQQPTEAEKGTEQSC